MLCPTLWPRPTAAAVVGLCMLILQQQLPAVEAVKSRHLLAYMTNKGCDLPDEDTCSYVLNTEACAPRSGMLHYLAIYACQLHGLALPATLLTLLWIGFLFVVMFTVADRFFCPAMELLSEWLHLSPAVAGATLLALGNGACDVFTQFAAAQSGVSGDLESLSMALSEPMGTSLFVGNVVLGITVAMAHGTAQHVTLRPSLFLKDALFYLASVLFMLVCLLLGKIYFWQCCFLVATWAVYVCLTVWLCKDEESVQLDPLQHEVPRLVPFGPWDDLDSDDLEDWDWLEALPADYKDIPHVHHHRSASLGDDLAAAAASPGLPALLQSVSSSHAHSQSLLTMSSDGQQRSASSLRALQAEAGEAPRSLVPGTDRRQKPSWLQDFQRRNLTSHSSGRRKQFEDGRFSHSLESREEEGSLALPLLSRRSQGCERSSHSQPRLSASYDDQALLAFKQAVTPPWSDQTHSGYQPPAPEDTHNGPPSSDDDESDHSDISNAAAQPPSQLPSQPSQPAPPIESKLSVKSQEAVKPPGLSRMPSKRQTEGLVSFVRSVSTRFKYPSAAGTGEGGVLWEAEPDALAGTSPESVSKVQNPFAPDVGSLEQRASSAGAAVMDEGLYVPLLMEGRLDQLQELMAVGSRTQEGFPGELQPDRSNRGGSYGSPAVASGSPAGLGSPAVISEAEGASPGGASPTARSNPDLALEKKRLMKLIYYGHQKRKQDADNLNLAAPECIVSDAAAVAEQPPHRAVTFNLQETVTGAGQQEACKRSSSQALTNELSFRREWLHGGLGAGGGGSSSALKLGSGTMDAQLSEVVAADVTERVKRLERSRHAWHWQLWRALRRPLVLLLSFTMPMIERSQHLHYTKASAVMLPLVGPPVYALMYGWWNPFDVTPSPEEIQPLDAYQLQTGMVCCCAASLLVLMLWRSDGMLDGPVVAICAALSFIGSMVWMNAVASELVGLLVAVGNVLDLPAALLGATVLSWGNSLPDAVSNSTMARDGYPTMAITACFASPLFVLLAGVACSLSIGSLPGSLAMPQDLPTLILYTTSSLNMVMWVIAIPFVFKYKLDWRVTLLGCGFYAVYQIAYVVFIIKYDEAS